MATTYAARYGDEPALRSNGAPYPPGTLVTVYLAGTDTLATLYVDRNRAPGPNPVAVKTNGNLGFYAEFENEYEGSISGGPRVSLPVSPDHADVATLDDVFAYAQMFGG